MSEPPDPNEPLDLAGAKDPTASARRDLGGGEARTESSDIRAGGLNELPAGQHAPTAGASRRPLPRRNAGGDPPAGEAPSTTARGRILRDALSVGIAVGAYGVAFGAASVAAGLSVLETSLLSLLAFTGGTQFAIVGVIAGGGSIGAATGAGLLLASRNTLYAMRLAPLLQVRGWRRLLAAHGTIDETTAMALARREPDASRLAFWATFAAIWVFWNAATVLGAAGASALGNPARFGLDAVVPAAFLALLAPRLRAGRIERWVALVAAVIAFVLIPITPAGVPVLAASAAVLLASRMTAPRTDTAARASVAADADAITDAAAASEGSADEPPASADQAPDGGGSADRGGAGEGGRQ